MSEYEDIPAGTTAEEEFTYSSDFDTNGLLHWIGTQGGCAKYANPHKQGFVFATMSTIHKGNPENIVENTPAGYPNYTKNDKKSWVMIDLGPHRRFIPNTYSIRHGSQGVGNAMRNWDFEGKMEETSEWVLLKRHTDDQTMTDGRGATASWALEVQQAAIDSTGYRFFRIKQTGKNSGGNDCLFCSGIELYGVLTLRLN
jgi:hypothetical protein